MEDDSVIGCSVDLDVVEVIEGVTVEKVGGCSVDLDFSLGC